MKIEFNDDEIRVGNRNYSISGNIIIESESDYGADADGNRGIHVDYIYDHELDVLHTDDPEILTTDEDTRKVLDYLEYNWRDFV